MCGIAGILNFKGQSVEKGLIQRMTDSMRHRGPDAEGILLDRELALGHRRLSIIDLSVAANQPLQDVSERYFIIFNGEIYNYLEIKLGLSDYPFQSHGDTEVILAAYIQWGADCLSRLRGMFTFAIWDKIKRELFIARDRLGVKPLYYYLGEGQFVFASEIRAILSVRNINPKIDHTALNEYFRYQSVGIPLTPIEGICQMEAGTYMWVKNGVKKTQTYWDPTTQNNDFDFTDRPSIELKVKELMIQSVKRRLVSDVPVGVLLSGGIDSSALVGLMIEAGYDSPETFNISFDESEFDESKYANLIVKKFSTRHREIRIKPDVMLVELTNALDAMDTPSGDGINSFVVSKAIHNEGIRVALSGVGGDELFAGYPIFGYYLNIQQKQWIWKSPAALRNALAILLGPGNKKNRIRQLIRAFSPAIENSYPIFRQLLSPSKIQELTALSESDGEILTKQLVSKSKAISKLPFLSQVTAAEYLGYAQNTLLKDIDQMSMANSLEIREPFFDQDLIEFVMSVPDDIKKPIGSKRLLVNSLKPMLPEEIIKRKKQGFVFPWNEWLRKDLRTFCDNHINRMAQRDFIHGNRLKLTWKRFLAGSKEIRWMEMWSFVVLNYWMEKIGVQ